jgi:hypothetical protein
MVIGQSVENMGNSQCAIVDISSKHSNDLQQILSNIKNENKVDVIPSEITIDICDELPVLTSETKFRNPNVNRSPWPSSSSSSSYRNRNMDNNRNSNSNNFYGNNKYGSNSNGGNQRGNHQFSGRNSRSNYDQNSYGNNNNNNNEYGSKPWTASRGGGGGGVFRGYSGNGSRE